METRIQSTGKLRSRHLPALYLDPSFFGRYVGAAAALAAPRPELAAAIPSLAAAEAAAFAELGRRLRAGTLGLSAVVSSLTLLRWMQETAPAYHASDREAQHAGGLADSDFEGLRYEGWLQHLLGDALAGILQVDLHAFALTVDAAWEEVPALALLDNHELWTLHALAARHLGCTHLATLRPGMARVCEQLHAAGGPQPLLGPAAVLAAASPPPPETIGE
jgi:hypothetical protein